jgi:hypothetical protein
MNQKTKNFLVILLLIIVGISTRFIFLLDGESVLPNFSAIGAVAIFGACYFKGFRKFLIPIGVLWLSDIILNNIVYSQYFDTYQAYGDLWVYGAFIVAGVIGLKMMKNPSWLKLLGTSITTGVAFYIITNFGVWMTQALYSKDIAGLIECYGAGLPFFRNTILSNVFYSFVLFGLFEFVFSRTFSLNRLITTPSVNTIT